MSNIETAVAFARGVPGLMLASPDAADSDDAFSLLRYASMIDDADDKPPQWKPEWFWNLVAKLSLRYWNWKYKGLAEARIREWYEQSRTTTTARSRPSGAPTLQPNDKKD
jgi:hypothetical protein